MAWKARLFMGLMLAVMLLAIAGPAMADDDNNREDRGEDRQEWREEWREHDDCGWRQCDFEEFEIEEFDIDIDDDIVPVAFVIEDIDVDCDGIDDRWDWWINDRCEVEVELEAVPWWWSWDWD